MAKGARSGVQAQPGRGQAPPLRSEPSSHFLRWAFILLSMIALALALFWHLRPAPGPDRVTPSDIAEAAASAPDAPERLKVKVLSVRPHDPEAFTQGLLL